MYLHLIRKQIQRTDTQSWNLNPVLQIYVLILLKITVSLCLALGFQLWENQSWSSLYGAYGLVRKTDRNQKTFSTKMKNLRQVRKKGESQKTQSVWDREVWTSHGSSRNRGNQRLDMNMTLFREHDIILRSEGEESKKNRWHSKNTCLHAWGEGHQHSYRAQLVGQEGVRPHRGQVKILCPYPKNNENGLRMGLIQSDVHSKNISLEVWE